MKIVIISVSVLLFPSLLFANNLGDIQGKWTRVSFLCRSADGVLEEIVNINIPSYSFIFENNNVVVVETNYKGTGPIISTNIYSIKDSRLVLKRPSISCTTASLSDCPVEGFNIVMDEKFTVDGDVLYIETMSSPYLGAGFIEHVSQKCDGTVLQLYKK